MRWTLLESSCMLRLCDKILASFMSKSKITLLLHTTLYASSWAIRGLGVQNPDTVPWNTKLYVHPQHGSMGIHPSPCSKCCTTLLSKGRNSISPCLVCLGFTHLQSKSARSELSLRTHYLCWAVFTVVFQQALCERPSNEWIPCTMITWSCGFFTGIAIKAESLLGLSENSVSHIPMDYHHVPH